jgi:DNA polymerase-3 subunit epsilon
VKRQVILDTETTGLDPQEGHRIIEIGCVELVGRKRTGRTFHEYVNPQRSIPTDSTAIHGIADEHVAQCPVFADLAAGFFEFVDGAELVIHNAPFDVGFLNFELGQAGFPRLEDHCQILDTLPEARHRHPGQKNDLDTLCQRYGVDNRSRDKHGALLDSELLADVYLAMTGGQESLELAAAESSPVEAAQRLLSTDDNGERIRLREVAPSDDELAAHRAFLERIREEGGSCLWLEREGGGEH